MDFHYYSIIFLVLLLYVVIIVLLFISFRMAVLTMKYRCTYISVNRDVTGLIAGRFLSMYHGITRHLQHKSPCTDLTCSFRFWYHFLHLFLQFSECKMREKLGERTFSFCGPAEWNCLPSELQMITDTTSFKKKLEAHFYNQAFCVDLTNSCCFSFCSISITRGAARGGACRGSMPPIVDWVDFLTKKNGFVGSRGIGPEVLIRVISYFWTYGVS